MKIELSRSGGIANIGMRVVVDTDKLPPDEATRITKLVSAVTPQRIKAQPDQFIYTLKVDRVIDGKNVSTTVRFVEGQHKELVEALTTTKEQLV